MYYLSVGSVGGRQKTLCVSKNVGRVFVYFYNHITHVYVKDDKYSIVMMSSDKSLLNQLYTKCLTLNRLTGI